MERIPDNYSIATSQISVNEPSINFTNSRYLNKQNLFTDFGSSEQDVFSTGSSVGQFSNALNDYSESNNHTDAISSSTGIRTRTRRPQSHPHIQGFMAQGDAPRRLRLQCELRVGSVNTKSSFESLMLEEDESKPIVAEVRSLLVKIM